MASVDTSKIKEHMEVIAADGEKIGKVDHMQDGKIKLTKHDSPDGHHHLVPLDWIDHIDEHVHLNKSLSDIRSITGSGSSSSSGVSATDAVPEVKVHDAVPTKG